MLNVTVATNLVVALKLVTTTMEPCACPDGIAGCCVAHFRKRTDVRYEDPKVAADIPAVVIDREDLGGLYEVWLRNYDDPRTPRTYPLKVCVEGGNARHTSETIVGLVSYEALAKALTELAAHKKGN